MVGIAGWALLSMGGRSWVGSGHPRVAAVVRWWVVIICDRGLSLVGVGSPFVVGDRCLWWGIVVCGGGSSFVGGGWSFVVGCYRSWVGGGHS